VIDTKAITNRLRLALVRAGAAAFKDVKAKPPEPHTGQVADSESLAEGRCGPLFQPRRVRPPNSTDLS
jgi:uncharacterized low-complexity protein